MSRVIPPQRLVTSTFEFSQCCLYASMRPATHNAYQRPSWWPWVHWPYLDLPGTITDYIRARYNLCVYPCGMPYASMPVANAAVKYHESDVAELSGTGIPLGNVL